jgi:anti-sigma B factor antagonist
MEASSSVQMLHWKEDITLKNIDSFAHALNRLGGEGTHSRFILNLEGVQYVNSAALGAIANTVLRLRGEYKDFVIAGISSTLHHIFDIVKFGSFIKLFTNMEEAAAYYETKHR